MAEEAILLKHEITMGAGNNTKTIVNFVKKNINQINVFDAHTALELTYFYEGEGIYTVDGEEWEFCQGDVFLVQSNISHAITKLNKSGAFYNVNFEPRLLWDSNGFFGSGFMHIFTSAAHDKKYRLARGNPKFCFIQEIFEKISTEFTDCAPGFEYMVKAYILELLTGIYRYYGFSEENDADLSEYNIEGVSKSVDYINEHLTEDLSVNTLARTANISQTYYNTLFKKLNGITPWEYVISKRVELAANRLISGNVNSMYRLAKECGFNNTANFNHAFRKYTGCVPSKYEGERV